MKPFSFPFITSLQEDGFYPVRDWKATSLNIREECLTTLKIAEQVAGKGQYLNQTWFVVTTEHIFVLSFTNQVLSCQKSIPLSQVTFLVIPDEEILTLQIVSKGHIEVIPIARPREEIYLKLKRMVNLLNLFLKVQKPSSTPLAPSGPQEEIIAEKPEKTENEIEINEESFEYPNLEVSTHELEALWAPLPTTDPEVES